MEALARAATPARPPHARPDVDEPRRQMEAAYAAAMAPLYEQERQLALWGAKLEIEIAQACAEAIDDDDACVAALKLVSHRRVALDRWTSRRKILARKLHGDEWLGQQLKSEHEQSREIVRPIARVALASNRRRLGEERRAAEETPKAVISAPSVSRTSTPAARPRSSHATSRPSRSSSSSSDDPSEPGPPRAASAFAVLFGDLQGGEQLARYLGLPPGTMDEFDREDALEADGRCELLR